MYTRSTTPWYRLLLMPSLLTRSWLRPFRLPGRLSHRLLLAPLLAALALAAGCGDARDRATGAGSTMTVLFHGDEWALGPGLETQAKMLVFLPLFEPGEHGSRVGKLARSYEVSADQRTWTYHLRTDVRWHDGRPVTAEDVAFSLALLGHPRIQYESELDSVAVLNDSTLRIHLPDPLDARYDWAVSYPRHHLEPLTADGITPEAFWSWSFWLGPVGNGPFRYVRHVPKTLIELEANADYYAGRPALDRVVLKFGGAAVPELLSGNVDAILNVRPGDLLKLMDDPRFIAYQEVSPFRILTINWNHRRPFFEDARVRRALTLAIDRREMLRVENLPDDLRLADVIYRLRQYWDGDIPEPLPHDPAESARLLDEAGWVRGPDGVRRRDGRAFEFTALYEPRVYEHIALFVQDQLRRVGVVMRLQPVDRGILLQRYRAGRFDAVFSSIVNGPFGAQFGYRPEFGDASHMGFRDPAVLEFVRSFDGERISLDDAVEDAAYRAIWPVFLEQQPVTMLRPVVNTHVAHRRIRGLSSPHRADPVRWAEYLWRED